MINYQNGFIKQSPIFLSFYFLTDYCMSVFSISLSKRCKFEKMIGFHWQAFIVFKNRENLKRLREIFRQEVIVSNVIWPS